jgi:hypothetical protein
MCVGAQFPFKCKRNLELFKKGLPTGEGDQNAYRKGKNAK